MGDANDNGHLDTHYDSVIRGLLRGRVTPVLGAGVNLCGRTTDTEQEKDWYGKLPPSAKQLALRLAAEFTYPSEPADDLLKVSQYAYAIGGGSGQLYDSLHDVFDVSFPRTAVHDFLASLPSLLAAQEKYLPPLIVTTNYDDVMEEALANSHDVVVYAAEGPHEGQMCVRAADGALAPIEVTKDDLTIDPDKKPVILKIHGFVARNGSGADDSYVIAEDHYIEFLNRLDLDNLLPVKVLARLRNCHFLFLGYSLSDWNLRAILHKLYLERRSRRDWWAVQTETDEVERSSWLRRNVTIFDMPLDTYVAGLDARLRTRLEASA
jgi:hypothetical protein